MAASNLVTRLATAVVMVPLMLALLFYGPAWGWLAFAMLVALVGAWELFGMPHPGDGVARGAGVLLLWLVVLAIWFSPEHPRLLLTAVLLLPFAKIMPPLYSWRMRARIYRWYRELEDVDNGFHDEHGAERREHWLGELDRLDSEVRQVRVPLSFAGQLYHLRQHIDLVRQRLLESR